MQHQTGYGAVGSLLEFYLGVDLFEEELRVGFREALNLGWPVGKVKRRPSSTVMMRLKPAVIS